MVRLQALDGARAGASLSGGRFPLRVGRAPENDFVLEDPGVWLVHFTLACFQNNIVLEPGADAPVRLNDETLPSNKKAPLHNGDIIGVGAVRLLFTFTPVRQRSLVLRESLTWMALALLALGEVAIAWVLI